MLKRQFFFHHNVLMKVLQKLKRFNVDFIINSSHLKYFGFLFSLYIYIYIYIYIYVYTYILWECWSSVNPYVVMCRTKCNIIWRDLIIYDRSIIIIMIINKYILYIYLIHGKYCSAILGFLKFITTFVRKLRWWNEIENRKCDNIQTKSKMLQNTDKKPLRFRVCVVVSMCVCMDVSVCVCVWIRVFKLSQVRNLKRWL